MLKHLFIEGVVQFICCGLDFVELFLYTRVDLVVLDLCARVLFGLWWFGTW